MSEEDIYKSSDIVLVGANGKKTECKNKLEYNNAVQVITHLSDTTVPDDVEVQKLTHPKKTDPEYYMYCNLSNASSLHSIQIKTKKLNESVLLQIDNSRVCSKSESSMCIELRSKKRRKSLDLSYCLGSSNSFVSETLNKAEIFEVQNENYATVRNETNSVLGLLKDNSSLSTPYMGDKSAFYSSNTDISVCNKKIGFLSNNQSHSTSLLDIPWLKKVSLPDRKEVQEVKILPAFHDPIFLDYNFVISEKMQKMINTAKNVSFEYKISDQNHLQVIRGSAIVKRIDVLTYGTSFGTLNDTVFFVGRNKYVKNEQRKEDARYKESLDKKTKYKCKHTVQEYRKEVFVQQINNKTNVFYIEDYEDLLDALKATVKSIDQVKKYVPKVKCFNTNKKKEYCENLIASVPGISKNVGNAISLYFENFYKFYSFLKDDIEKVANLYVYSDDKKNQRKLGLRQALLLKKAFLSDAADKIIKD